MTTFVDILLLWIGVEYLLLPVIPWATGLAFIGALIFSFVLNSLWTFASANQGKSIWQAEKIIKFLFVSFTAFGLTLLLMWVFTHQLEMFYLYAKIFTSLVVLAWNFLGNSLWTFSGQEEKIGGITLLPPEVGNFKYHLSVIIPAYNEEKRIGKTLQQAQQYFDAQKFSYEILVVSDGSTDKTLEVAQQYLSLPHRGVEMKQNKGKGRAIARGVEDAKGRYILFCDADGATPFAEYEGLENMMDTYHIAIGSRYLDTTKDKGVQRWYRVFFSRIINFFAQVFLVDGFSDTQCGFKLFRSQSAHKIFEQQKIYRYAFDIECLVLAKKYHYHVAEVPVEWYDQEGSKFDGVRDGFKTAYDFIRIKFFMMFRMYS